MNLTSFINFIWSMFSRLYVFTDSIHPFTDFPDLSLFWLFESLFLTSVVWMFFPAGYDEDFSESCETQDDPDIEPFLDIYADDDDL